MFKEGRVVILMDGFDEISPSYKEFNLNVMKAILNQTESSNQLWISTRPHLQEELAKTVKPKNVHKLKPLTKVDRRKFLKHLIRNKQLEQCLKAKIDEIERFLYRLEYS